MLPAFDYQISQHHERIRRIEIDARRRESMKHDNHHESARGRQPHRGWLGLGRAFGHAFGRSMPGRPS
jgi:hypothetical protein